MARPKPISFDCNQLNNFSERLRQIANEIEACSSLMKVDGVEKIVVSKNAQGAIDSLAVLAGFVESSKAVIDAELMSLGKFHTDATSDNAPEKTPNNDKKPDTKRTRKKPQPRK